MTAEQEDNSPLNNVLAKDILYTDDMYGHDDENAHDGELRPRESDDIDDFFDPTGYGSFYHCPNPGSVAYGIAVRFGANSGLTIDGAEDDLEFETRLYTLDGSAGITDSPFDAAYWVYDVTGATQRARLRLRPTWSLTTPSTSARGAKRAATTTSPQ